GDHLHANAGPHAGRDARCIRELDSNLYGGQSQSSNNATRSFFGRILCVDEVRVTRWGRGRLSERRPLAAHPLSWPRAVASRAERGRGGSFGDARPFRQGPRNPYSAVLSGPVPGKGRRSGTVRVD